MNNKNYWDFERQITVTMEELERDYQDEYGKSKEITFKQYVFNCQDFNGGTLKPIK